MNYREWLVYRAQQYENTESEPEVLRYNAWRNHELVRDWIRRADAAQISTLAGRRGVAAQPTS